MLTKLEVKMLLLATMYSGGTTTGRMYFYDAHIYSIGFENGL